jgi:RNA polymerase II subunit A-like phosphatase
MSEETTPLHLPGHFPYPITITKLSLGPGEEVQRGIRLLEYSFTSATNRKLAYEARRKGEKVTVKENDMVGSWECSVEGTLERWAKHVEVGRSIDAKGARYACTVALLPADETGGLFVQS